YPEALATIAHLKTFGAVAIISDGDPVFQAAKIGRAGLAEATDGHVFISAHKEAHQDELLARFPAECLIVVDDKPDILSRLKARLGPRVVTIHLRQGHYARPPGGMPQPP